MNLKLLVGNLHWQRGKVHLQIQLTVALIGADRYIFQKSGKPWGVVLQFFCFFSSIRYLVGKIINRSFTSAHLSETPFRKSSPFFSGLTQYGFLPTVTACTS